MNAVTFDSLLPVEKKPSQPVDTEGTAAPAALLWQQEQLSLSPSLATKASRMGSKCHQSRFQ